MTSTPVLPSMTRRRSATLTWTSGSPIPDNSANQMRCTRLIRRALPACGSIHVGRASGTGTGATRQSRVRRAARRRRTSTRHPPPCGPSTASGPSHPWTRVRHRLRSKDSSKQRHVPSKRGAVLYVRLERGGTRRDGDQHRERKDVSVASLVYHRWVMADSKPAALATAAASPFATSVTQVRPHVGLIGLLALGHFVVDLTQGALPAVLPFLKDRHGLSYAETGTIVLAANLTSSIIQPLFGYLADQTVRRWILPTSIVVAGAGMALTGVARDYTSIVLLVVVMGLGVAAWHPEGYRTATGVAGDRKATALSYFSLGGNAGIALGPLFVTFLVTTWSAVGTLGLVLPPLLVAGLMLAALPSFGAVTASPSVKRAGGGENMPAAMALLILVVMIRAWATLGFTTFVPLYYVNHL